MKIWKSSIDTTSIKTAGTKDFPQPFIGGFLHEGFLNGTTIVFGVYIINNNRNYKNTDYLQYKTNFLIQENYGVEQMFLVLLFVVQVE